MSKIVCITMARMTSSRLRGKPLMEIAGKPLLGYHIERLKKAKSIDEIVVATTDKVTDELIEEFCDNKGVNCFRGSEDDVLLRYYQCAKEYEADIIIRVTGDCPLIDPVLIDELVELYQSDDGLDYASLDIAKYPRGFDCEIFSRDILNEVHNEATEPYHREHVTNYIYSQPARYNISTLTMDADYSNLRFCVDEEADFKLIEKIVQGFVGCINEVSWEEIVDLVIKTPELKELNNEVVQHIPEG